MMLDLGLVPDPDRDWKMVQAAKLKRMELVLGPQKALAQPKKPTPDTADEEEKEEEEGQGDAEEEEEGGGDDGDAGEEGGEDKEEGDDDGEEKVAITPVFVPAKGPNLSREDLWDNFSIKSMKMTEDDDDDDDEEDEGTSSLDPNPVPCECFGHSGRTAHRHLVLLHPSRQRR